VTGGCLYTFICGEAQRGTSLSLPRSLAAKMWPVLWSILVRLGLNRDDTDAGIRSLMAKCNGRLSYHAWPLHPLYPRN